MFKLKTNKKLKKNYPWQTHFRSRNAVVAKVIPDGASILDLGGGFGGITRFTKPETYVSLDLELYTNLTVKANFNKGIFPEVGRFQFLICQGILEYLDQPAEFLKKIKKYGDIMLLTYRKGQADSKQKNNMDFPWVRMMLTDCGWEIVFERPIANAQRFFYCRKK